MYLRKAYEVAAMCMNGWTWQQCCEEPISILAHAGIKKVSYHRTVANWNITFRKYETFLNPQGWKGAREPRAFTLFPELKTMILDYCSKNQKSRVNVIRVRCYRN
eukprot:scaffold40214_cov30-Attheya_sp.AAC.1